VDLSEKREKPVKELYDAVVAMDEDRVRALCASLVADGVDAQFAVKHGLMAAMEKAGELYAYNVYYVSELLLCADALRAGLEILGPHVEKDASERKKQIIIGTVEGDIHDVGKNLVKTMFQARMDSLRSRKGRNAGAVRGGADKGSRGYRGPLCPPVDHHACHPEGDSHDQSRASRGCRHDRGCFPHPEYRCRIRRGRICA